jgi:hypothetical protein
MFVPCVVFGFILSVLGILIGGIVCFVAFAIMRHYVRGAQLRAKFLSQHGRNGKYILFVYSNSPNWKEYIETNILPKLEPFAVVLNWSKRSEWRGNMPLEAKIVDHFGSYREYNPIAIAMRRGYQTQVIRFFQAFRDYKHGKDRLLRKQEEKLFTLVEWLRQFEYLKRQSP